VLFVEIHDVDAITLAEFYGFSFLLLRTGSFEGPANGKPPALPEVMTV
jgi:hypothetical protein